MSPVQPRAMIPARAHGAIRGWARSAVLSRTHGAVRGRTHGPGLARRPGSVPGPVRDSVLVPMPGMVLVPSPGMVLVPMPGSVPGPMRNSVLVPMPGSGRGHGQTDRLALVLIRTRQILRQRIVLPGAVLGLRLGPRPTAGRSWARNLIPVLLGSLLPRELRGTLRGKIALTARRPHCTPGPQLSRPETRPLPPRAASKNAVAGPLPARMTRRSARYIPGTVSARHRLSLGSQRWTGPMPQGHLGRASRAGERHAGPEAGPEARPSRSVGPAPRAHVPEQAGADCGSGS
jgi:hypothetical protein